MAALQKLFDASAVVVSGIEASLKRDAVKSHYLLRAFPKVVAATPFVGTCIAAENIARAARRPLDTSKLQ